MLFKLCKHVAQVAEHRPACRASKQNGVLLLSFAECSGARHFLYLPPPPPCPSYASVRKKCGPNGGCTLDKGVPWTRGGGMSKRETEVLQCGKNEPVKWGTKTKKNFGFLIPSPGVPSSQYVVFLIDFNLISFAVSPITWTTSIHFIRE